MVGASIINAICDRVKTALVGDKSVMADDPASLWADFQNHVLYGSSLVESLLTQHVESLIQLELEKLPQSILDALWWNTEKGEGLLIEVEVDFEHGDAIDPQACVLYVEGVKSDLVAFILEQLARKAERESIEGSS